MTECNAQPIVFSSLARRQVVADFGGGAIVSDAGALLLREVDRKLGLIDQLDAVIPDPRNPELIIHRQSTMLRQRIFAIALGYEDGNDHQSLRDDPLMQLVSERGIDPDQPLASPPTLCRLENRVRRRTLFDIAKVFVDVFIASHKEPPTELVLDFDATDDPVHGNQLNRFFHGYYDGYCFLPLYVFCGDHLLCAYLRPADIDPAKHAWAILSLLVKRFRQVWPSVKIIFRGDSGFCRWKMLRWCDKHGVFYLVGLAKNSRLKQMAEPFVQQAEDQFNATDAKQRIFADIQYAAYTWDQPRRVIVKAERLELGPNLRFVVTNLEEDDPQRLYDQLYCKRGEAENRIKEQQLGLFADRTSCHDFAANQFRVLLSAAAYVLLQHLREHALAGTELAEAQVSTLRVKLLKIGALIKRSARRVVLHLAGGCPVQDLFRLIAAKLLPVVSSA
ncbi:MAG: IS1380 family transposase [Tepidisphaeraceae bacterium]